MTFHSKDAERLPDVCPICCETPAIMEIKENGRIMRQIYCNNPTCPIQPMTPVIDAQLDVYECWSFLADHTDWFKVKRTGKRVGGQ